MRETAALALAVVLVVGTGLVVAVGAVGGDSGEEITAAIETAESVEHALEIASETTVQLVSGAITGAGMGLLLGSGLTFLYWRRQIG